MANRVTLELPRADGTLDHDVRTLRQRPSVLGEFAEGDHPVPVRPTLPFAFSVLPGLLSRDGNNGDDRAVLCVMNFGFCAGKADKCDLVERVHMLCSPFLPCPVRPGATEQQASPP